MPSEEADDERPLVKQIARIHLHMILIEQTGDAQYSIPYTLRIGPG